MLYLLEKSETCPVSSRRRGRGVASFWKSMKDSEILLWHFQEVQFTPMRKLKHRVVKRFSRQIYVWHGVRQRTIPLSYTPKPFFFQLHDSEEILTPADLGLPSMWRWRLQGSKGLKKIKMKIHWATSPSWHHTSPACTTEILLECVFV